MNTEDDIGNVSLNNFISPNDSLLGGAGIGYMDETIYGLEEQYKPASKRKFYVGIITGIFLFLLIASGLFYLIVYMPNDKYELLKKGAIYDSESPIVLFHEHNSYQNYIFESESVNWEILNGRPIIDYRPISVPPKILEEETILLSSTEDYGTSTRVIPSEKIMNVVQTFNVHVSRGGAVEVKKAPETTTKRIETTPRVNVAEFKVVEADNSDKEMYDFSSYSQDPDGSTINRHERIYNVSYQMPKKTCEDIKSSGPSTNGIYKLTINENKVRAVCDMQAEFGPYMVIQRRVSSDVVFWNRSLEEYKYGFGDLATNFWFGLEHLYQYQEYVRSKSLKKDYVLLLRIELRLNPCDTKREKCPINHHVESNYYWHEYKMNIGSAKESYVLNIESIGGNLSTLDDFFFKGSNGRNFTTTDSDNDNHPDVNCAKYSFSGGWWYHRCGYVTLNGAYVNPKNRKSKSGMRWLVTSPVNNKNDASSGREKYFIKPHATLMLVKPL
uniref:Fibrinogen C-terminal domain-containing protein n=1 Tax=Parastrongyloides trichosuri TaxID=131310 RepID=A0A0N4ZKH2_PARTI